MEAIVEGERPFLAAETWLLHSMWPVLHLTRLTEQTAFQASAGGRFLVEGTKEAPPACRRLQECGARDLSFSCPNLAAATSAGWSRPRKESNMSYTRLYLSRGLHNRVRTGLPQEVSAGLTIMSRNCSRQSIRHVRYAYARYSL